LSSLLLALRPPAAPPFPYTTLFRSGQALLTDQLGGLDHDLLGRDLVVRIRRVVTLDPGVRDLVEDLETGLVDGAHDRVLGRELRVLVDQEELAARTVGSLRLGHGDRAPRVHRCARTTLGSGEVG